VDTEVTGKALLSKGQLQKRVTIIPLNKIDARPCSAQQVAAADRAGCGEAKLALSLVTCDAEVGLSRVIRPHLTGARAKAWCLLIHAEASLSLSPSF